MVGCIARTRRGLGLALTVVCIVIALVALAAFVQSRAVGMAAVRGAHSIALRLVLVAGESALDEAIEGGLEGDSKVSNQIFAGANSGLVATASISQRMFEKAMPGAELTIAPVEYTVLSRTDHSAHARLILELSVRIAVRSGWRGHEVSRVFHRRYEALSLKYRSFVGTAFELRPIASVLTR